LVSDGLFFWGVIVNFADLWGFFRESFSIGFSEDSWKIVGNFRDFGEFSENKKSWKLQKETQTSQKVLGKTKIFREFSLKEIFHLKNLEKLEFLMVQLPNLNT
jgi:hypothetical protein